MQNTKIDRLNELNKLWFRLHVPKEGDRVKFKVNGSDQIHEGQIASVEKSGNRFRFQMVSKTASATGSHQVTIVEINGVKFEEIKNPYKTDLNEFKPI